MREPSTFRHARSRDGHQGAASSGVIGVQLRPGTDIARGELALERRCMGDIDRPPGGSRVTRGGRRDCLTARLDGQGSVPRFADCHLITRSVSHGAPKRFWPDLTRPTVATHGQYVPPSHGNAYLAGTAPSVGRRPDGGGKSAKSREQGYRWRARWDGFPPVPSSLGSLAKASRGEVLSSVVTRGGIGDQPKVLTASRHDVEVFR